MTRESTGSQWSIMIKEEKKEKEKEDLGAAGGLSDDPQTGRRRRLLCQYGHFEPPREKTKTNLYEEE